MATLKTIRETLLTLDKGKAHTFFIAKKGKKYLTFKNNELALSKEQLDAVLFKTEEHIENFIEAATIDDRNAQVIGNSYTITNITLSRQ